MPTTTIFTGGVTNGNSIAVPLPFPSIEREGSAVDSVSVIRSLGRLLTDGDQALVGISHQTDILTTALLDDPDDFLQENDYDLWWVHGLSETDHVQDRLDVPQVVAGPQTFIFHNGAGATGACRVDVSWHVVPIPDLTRWSLLKQLTSYEALT